MYSKFLALFVFFIVGCSFSNISAFAANTPFSLPSPETGWQRINDTDSRIDYKYKNTYPEKCGDYHYNAGTIKFNFTGTKIRLIYQCQTTSYDSVLIDGKFAGQISASSPYSVWCDFERTDLSNSMHTVEIQTYVGTAWNSQFDAVDIGSDAQLYPYSTVCPLNLTAKASSGQVTLNWDPVEGASGYIVRRGTKSGVYDTTFNATSNNYIDTTVNNNTTYYYVVSTSTTTNSNEVSVTSQTSLQNLSLDVTSSADTVMVGNEFNADIVLNNASSIFAEDVTFTYDKDLFQYEGYSDISGAKVQKINNDTATGTIRFIASSLGSDKGITGSKSLIKLKFKAINCGKGKIDATKGRVADLATETDIASENCGEKSITVTNGDVNKSGEYTLVDLAVDAYYYGKNASDTDTTKYNADQNSDGKIDDSDLSYVVSQILSNSNYGPNK